MHNYGETCKAAIEARLINCRFTGNLQYKCTCILKAGQIHLINVHSTADDCILLKGDFTALLNWDISTLSDFTVKAPYYVWLLMFPTIIIYECMLTSNLQTKLGVS